MKIAKLTAIAFAVVLLFASAILLRRHQRANVAQAQRDASYTRVLAIYKHDLPLGITRPQVKAYLDRHGVMYTGMYWGQRPDAPAFAVKIGEDPGDGWVCDRWAVYVGLDFNASGVEKFDDFDGLPTDKLYEVKLHRIGHCM